MTTQIHDIPGAHVASYAVRAHAAATATENCFLFRAPFKAELVSVELIPDADITGADSNSSNVNLVNAGTDGAGATELANVDYASGTNATAGDAIALYAPAAPLALAEGTILKLQLEKVGTGLALPSFLALVTYRGA